MENIRLAYVDDSGIQREMTKDHLSGKEFHDPNHPTNGFKFDVVAFKDYETFKECPEVDVLLLDIDLGKDDDYQESKKILKYALKHHPDTTIIMYSSMDDDDLIAEFMFLGAHNYILKGVDVQNIHIPIIESYMTALKKKSDTVISPFKLDRNKFIGKTILSLPERISQIVKAKSIRSVFIHGETGTGKEVVSELFHEASKHFMGLNTPFVAVNCGAIANDLIEAELFGAVKGAYTGSTKDKAGYFEKASGGWIFLDEVADLSPSAQNSLMRVIENNELRRVGDNTVKKIDVRVISATNENLHELSQNGRFRYDLIRRLTATQINLPPLKEREDHEFEQLTKHFADTAEPDRIFTLAGPSLKLLKSYDWPGNVRELRDVINEMTLNAASNGTLYPNAIPEAFMNALRSQRDQRKTTSKLFELTLNITENLCTRKDIEKTAFALIYEHFKGTHSLQSIGKIFGISHVTCIKMAKELDQEGLIKLENFTAKPHRKKRSRKK